MIVNKISNVCLQTGRPQFYWKLKMTTDNTQQDSPAGIELQLLDWVQAKPLAEHIRRTVFIEEQHVPESEEWDDEDDEAIHVIAIHNGQAVATARITLAGKIGRMAVLKAHRKHGIASMMLLKLIKEAQQQGHQEIKLWSQTYAQGFYKKHGFKTQGDVFLDAGIPHIEMSLLIG